MMAQFLGWISTFFQRTFGSMMGYISELFGYLFQKLFDLLELLFRPFFILFAIIFYFFFQLGKLVLLLFMLLLGIGKIFFALVKGIFLTLAGFTFTPSTRNDGAWTNVFNNVVGGLDFYQIDTLAYVLLFLIWFSTAFVAIKLLGSMKGGD
ncbi:hypothetical protein [Paenibacillus agricola]|uniref:TrbL/VirB6 plasmid conjugal transfer protein n=1 Tax=Paenibacillus agricola TaxID=2716264 RepID=A0ABX0JKU8_9BACL|nr:hypothetical protein [Paenibacillus agricola]NHN35563.1 hypothetical protein [Paenibacillus agricola]